jgi:hypothetical protein
MTGANLAELASQMSSAHIDVLKGHDFSRAVNAAKWTRALAPEGCFSMLQFNAGFRAMVIFALGISVLLAHGQSDLPGRSILKGAEVEYLFPEQVTLTAGKPAEVALHFRIAKGLHINSHTPRDEFLIPATLSIPDGAGVRLLDASYPAGTDFTLPLDPKNKLSVYTGEFVIQARIVAKAGDHLVEARLRFQACDKTQCMPPKTIPVAMDVVGK